MIQLVLCFNPKKIFDQYIFKWKQLTNILIKDKNNLHIMFILEILTSLSEPYAVLYLTLYWYGILINVSYI